METSERLLHPATKAELFNMIGWAMRALMEITPRTPERLREVLEGTLGKSAGDEASVEIMECIIAGAFPQQTPSAGPANVLAFPGRLKT